jgi:hypothetical protein
MSQETFKEMRRVMPGTWRWWKVLYFYGRRLTDPCPL